MSGDDVTDVMTFEYRIRTAISLLCRATQRPGCQQALASNIVYRQRSRECASSRSPW